ncbi:MAG: tRNA uridine-5-carboxymethylaminomethyl(34) synthesis GTPase MnmE [Acidiferrobacteraceae bacterium]
MSTPADTIVAIATAPGPGAVGIVRVSGPLVRTLAERFLGSVPPPRYATYGRFMDEDTVLDKGLALFFPGPHSLTGEDVLELQGHGGPAVLNLLVKRALTLGARLARPGEFSERAFLNGKLDLAQAEAVADLIGSASEAAARAAVRSLEGVFSKAVHALVDRVIALRLRVESAIDFADEEIAFDGDDTVMRVASELAADIGALRREAESGRVLKDGLLVALIGAPNTGKSSLLNALAAQDAAIVSPAAGTTRDLLRVSLTIAGVPVELVDTAGLRDAKDEVEREGVRRAEQVARQADTVLLVVDDCLPETGVMPPADTATFIVHNKIDLTGRAPGSFGDGSRSVAVSARTGAGLDALRDLIVAQLPGHGAGGAFTARARHLDALTRAEACLAEGARVQEAGRGLELFAEDLRQAQQALDEITGRFTADDLLGRIFSTFCIGK